MIDVDNLRIKFGDREVVKGVSFSVEKGGSFGIVGESGSGKSTILRAMAGLNESWEGRIFLAPSSPTKRRTSSTRLSIWARVPSRNSRSR